MSNCRRQQETDFRRLVADVADDWNRREEPDTTILLQEATQAFIGRTSQEADNALGLLLRLERVGVLTPNAVHLLGDLSDMLGCEQAKRLVRNYLEKHPPAASGSTKDKPRPWSAPAKLSNKNDQVGRESNVQRRSAAQSTSDFEPLISASLVTSLHPLGDEMSSFETLDWPSTGPSESNPEEVLAMHDSRDFSTSESAGRTRSWPELEGSSVGGSSVWPPLESVETAESRLQSALLWGHGPPSPQPAVCECYLPHVPPAAPRRHRSQRPAASVQQVLDMRPTPVSSSASSSGNRRNAGAVAARGHMPAITPSGARNAGAAAATGHMPAITPSGARRARLVDFLSQRLGARYLELGEQLVTATELANITGDISSDLVSRARRLLHLYLSRHPREDGDVELTLVRRLRTIRFNRLADELELWGAEQDDAEDPRDWPEDRRRWREERSGRRPGRTSRHIPRMACC